MPDIGTEAMHSMEASLHVAADMTKLSREVLLAVMRLVWDKLDKGEVSLKKLNRTAAQSGVSLSSVTVPDKEAQAIVDDLRRSGVTFAVKREGDGIRIFFYAPSTEVIKAALDEAIRSHAREAEKASETEEKQNAPPEEEQTTQEPESAAPEEEKEPEQPTSEAKTAEKVPLYLYGADYAREHGELELYRASLRENIVCRDAIQQAIRENYDGAHLNHGISRDLIAQFGSKRVLYVTAATVANLYYDGRISRKNRDWAQEEVPEPDKHADRYRLNVHPGILNLFVTEVRDYIDHARSQARESAGKVKQAVFTFPESVKAMREEQSSEETEANPTKSAEKASKKEKTSVPPEEKAATEPEYQPFDELLKEGAALAKAHNAKFAKERSQPERGEPTR